MVWQELDGYILIGEAYVHGIMYGEVLEGKTANEVFKEEIVLY